MTATTLYVFKPGKGDEAALLFVTGKNDRDRMIGYTCRLTPEGFIHPCHSNGRRGAKFELKVFPFTRAAVKSASRRGNNLLPAKVLRVDDKLITKVTIGQVESMVEKRDAIGEEPLRQMARRVSYALKDLANSEKPVTQKLINKAIAALAEAPGVGIDR